MKLTLKDLIEKSDSLIKLLQKEVPIKTAYRLGRLSNAVKSELQQYELHRNNLIKKYGVEKDGQFQIDINDKTAVDNFIKENDELLSIEVELNSYEPLPITELGDIKLSASDMGNLSIFFIE